MLLGQTRPYIQPKSFVAMPLQSLCIVFNPVVICFQWFAASFPETPGVAPLPDGGSRPESRVTPLNSALSENRRSNSFLCRSYAKPPGWVPLPFCSATEEPNPLPLVRSAGKVRSGKENRLT